MHFIITNREIIVDPTTGKESIRADGKEKAGDNLRFGTYEVDKRRFTLFPEPDSSNQITYSGMKDIKTKELKGSARFFREIYDHFVQNELSDDKSDVLFYIHGFNTSLDDLRDNLDILDKRYVKNASSSIGRIVAFTWPGKSPDIPLHYNDDKKDAMRSGETLARCVDKLVSFFKEFLLRERNKKCEGKVHLLAHSMGNRVLKHMLLEMREKKIASPEIFDQIILIAADVEYDLFEETQPFNYLIEMGQRIHIYFHKNDLVLDISKYTKNFNNRMGRYGRKKNDPNAVDIFDCDVSSTSDDRGTGMMERKLNHWYFHTSSEVVQDLCAVMKGKLSAFRVKK